MLKGFSRSTAAMIITTIDEKIEPGSSLAVDLKLPKTISCSMVTTIRNPITVLIIQPAKLPLKRRMTPNTKAKIALMVHSLLLRYPKVNIIIQLSRSP